jgi:hypothetical protein
VKEASVLMNIPVDGGRQDPKRLLQVGDVLIGRPPRPWEYGEFNSKANNENEQSKSNSSNRLQAVITSTPDLDAGDKDIMMTVAKIKALLGLELCHAVRT